VELGYGYTRLERGVGSVSFLSCASAARECASKFYRSKLAGWPIGRGRVGVAFRHDDLRGFV